MTESGRYVAEGSVDLGPKENFFVFLDGEHLGTLLREHFGVAAETGFTSLGQLRITVERLDGLTEPGDSKSPEA